MSDVRNMNVHASLRRRSAAATADVLVLGAVFVVLGLTLGDAEAADGSATLELTGAPAVLWFALAFLYYFVSELCTGRTLGKALLGLRVVREGGPLNAASVAVRTVLRVVDVLPVFYLVGFITAVATGDRRQRLGDVAARTYVVHAPG